MNTKLFIICGTISGLDFNIDGKLHELDIKPMKGHEQHIFVPDPEWCEGTGERVIAEDCLKSILDICDYTQFVAATCIRGEEGELILRSIRPRGTKDRRNIFCLSEIFPEDDQEQGTDAPDQEPERPEHHHKHRIRRCCCEEWSHDSTVNGCEEW